jgi:protein-disulfide isomerase
VHHFAAIVASLALAGGCGGGGSAGPVKPVPSSPHPSGPSATASPRDGLTVGTQGAPALGSPRARVVMVEFTDYECPFCRRYHRDTFPAIKAEYVDTGKVRYVVRDLPLDIHPHAASAAEAARCAGDQGRLWAMREALLEDGQGFSPERFVALAREAGADTGTFKACLDSRRFAPAVNADVKEALAGGLDRTPSFVIGRATASGVDGVRVVGARPLSTFKAVIEEALHRP